jgi:phosphate transport system substrate-binding protein
MPSNYLVLLFVAIPLIGLFIKKSLVRKISGSILCFEALFVLWFILELIADSPALKQLLGVSMVWLAFVICGGIFLTCLIAIWKPFRAKVRKILTLALSAAVIVTIASAAGVQAYKNSFVEIGDADRDMEISLLDYLPFDDTFPGKTGIAETLVKMLDEPSTLSLADNLPQIDGATALYPLYSAFVRATYPQGDYNPSDTVDEITGLPLSSVCYNRTGAAFDNLLYGQADVIFLMDVSEEQAAKARELGVELKLTPIGRDAFVFLVNSRNKVIGLTQDEVRKIYSGEITNWREVGGANDTISAYQRPEGSGGQTALQKIMGNIPIAEPKGELVYSFMGGLYNAAADYKNYKNALGYSFRYYIETMLNDAELGKVELLEIDGIAPTPETIADGTYPYGDNFYAITVANREPANDIEKATAENTQKLVTTQLLTPTTHPLKKIPIQKGNYMS